MQNFQGITAFVAHIVLDRCQIYARKARWKNIVKTAHAVVAWYGKAALAHSINNPIGHHVVYRHKGGNFFVVNNKDGALLDSFDLNAKKMPQ